MLYSMTGYGKSSQTLSCGELHVDVRSLNSRYLDYTPRLPKLLAEHEAAFRQLVTDRLQRGKVTLTLELVGGAGTTQDLEALNGAQLQAYRRQLEQLGEKDVPLAALLQLPGVAATDTTAKPLTEPDLQLALEAVRQALAACVDFRQQEGASTQRQLEANLTALDQGLSQVTELDPRRVPRIKERIQKNLDEWVGSDKYDPNRFEQELIFYVEKLDISEEKTRLSNHLSYFRQVLAGSDDQVGKKLNFLAQEMGREINTLGSKANDSGIQQVVVAMKEELEQIKEQVANLL